ncbi:MAG: urease accessory protein UreE [Rhizobiales bacterium]|nr:urease accessory protein UreE [Hyphomicrobiales bacterium]
MIRASHLIPASKADASATDGLTVTLTQDQRYRRRIALKADQGLDFLLDLPEAVLLRHGDELKLEDGRHVRVQAVPEDLLQVTAQSEHHMIRLAWHLGNRHLEAQIEETRILIRPDHVISEMLEKLGAEISTVTEPFNPEGGAYGSGHAHHHEH